MNWQTNGTFLEEEASYQQPRLGFLKEDLSIQNEKIKALQLEKFQDPSKDAVRQSYIAVLAAFGDLLMKDMKKEIASTLLSEECEIFIFSSTGRTPVKWALKQEGFMGVYENIQIQERKVRETFVDKDHSTAFQLCNCKVLYRDENVIEEEISFEAFTIKDGKIFKYIANYAHMTPAHGNRDPFEPKKKDIMLSKVKNINYALAGKPDLDKVASLLHESTEYKIWSWNSQKCIILNKRNFVEAFSKLEENYMLKCIVPYEIYSEREYLMGTYVYHLEGKDHLAGKKFVWLSTSVYAFDRHLNIAKISQQGELYPEEEGPPLPFETYPKEKLKQLIRKVTENCKPNLDIFYDNTLNFACDVYQFAAENFPNTGYFEGLKGYNSSMLAQLEEEMHLDWVRVIDVFVDQNGPSHDTVITLTYSEGAAGESQTLGKTMGYLMATKWEFENGKLAKILVFVNEILDVIPSPFYEKDFEALNLVKKKNTY